MILMTENTVYNSLSHDINTTQVRAYKASRQAATGLRVMTADDDPIAAARSSLLGASISGLETMGRVAAIAESQIGAAEGALTGAQDVLSRARELAVLAANGSYSGEERKQVAAEMHVLQDTMLSLANTDVGGTYLFAGTSGVKPFEQDGTYVGDEGVRNLDVAPGIRISANLPGSAAFSVVGGQNIIGMLSSLAAGLESDDVQAVYNAIDNLDRSMDQINSARSTIGGTLSELTLAENQRTEANILMRKDRADTIEVDQAEALVRMVEAQTAYQTALAEAARILSQLQNNPLTR
jgi:flagellar hook-associated protein 3 FlgL